jgi:hypothetical protein
MRNPYNLLMNSGYAKEYRTAIQSKVYVDQKLDFITKGLSVRLNASYDYDSEMIVRREYIRQDIMLRDAMKTAIYYLPQSYPETLNCRTLRIVRQAQPRRFT